MHKYGKHKVLSLRDQALNIFGTNLVKIVIHQVNKKVNEKFIIVEMDDYLHEVGADSIVRQELFDKVGKTAFLSRSVANICFSILIDESISVFSSISFWNASNKRKWKLMARNCTNLRTFNWFHKPLLTADIVYIEKILQNNKKLIHLTLWCGTEKNLIRELIDRHCKQLKYLHFIDRDCITNDAEFLSRSNISKKLIKIGLDLTNFDVDNHKRAVAKILQCCPNLQMFEYCNNIGSALRICLAQNPEFTCNLIKLRTMDASRELLETIVKTCPKLKQLHLIAPQQGSLQALEKAAFEDLTVENLYKISELMAVLKKFGKYLFGFAILGGSECLDICELRRSCPMLTRLVLEFLPNVQMDGMSVIFPYLQKLKIYRCHLTKSVLAKLLHSAQNLSTLQINQAHFDDELIKSVFNGCYFKNLIELETYDEPQMTAQSVKLLLERCPNLQTLGFWNLIARENDMNALSLQAIGDIRIPYNL